MSQGKTYSISSDVVFRDMSGEGVLLNLATGTYFGLDGVGTRVWHLLAEHRSVEAVIEALLLEYEVDEQELRHDVDTLLRQCEEKGLVKAGV
jgi:hypothetical protein